MLSRFVEKESSGGQMNFETLGIDDTKSRLERLVKIGKTMAQKYDAVVTNPPYMGRKSLNIKLSKYIEDNYAEGKSEMYAAFIEKCSKFTKNNGYSSMITVHTWMFISTFKNLRKSILLAEDIVSMLHTGPATFEELNSFNVLATVFIRRNSYVEKYKGTYIKLTDYYNLKDKINNFDNVNDRYYINQNIFFYIQEQPIIYWLSEETYDIFKSTQKIEDFGYLTNGLFTCDNARFVRYWYEVSIEKTMFDCHSKEDAINSGRKWFPYIKGGNYRKWYGNNEYVVNYQYDGNEIREYRIKQGQSKRFPGEDFYFQPGITWAPFGFENFGVRYKFYGNIFDIAGSSLFVSDKEDELYILGFLASKVGFYLLSTIAPTVNFQIGNIGNLPLIKSSKYKNAIIALVRENIELSINEWDDYEVSWDFSENSLVRGNVKFLSEAYEDWENYTIERYARLKENEEQINDMFIAIYHMEQCIDRSVADRDISLRKADKKNDVKMLLSYAVGCMFGRYSLDVDGLAYAGGEWDSTKYSTFIPDVDNVIPITDEEYFSNDIVGRFCEWLKVVYGEDTLEENLDFIAKALGNKGDTSREVIRNYFLKDFYADHLKVYQKRPIYWLFDSGKQNGFKALIYMHRYDADTVGRVRTDYLHRAQKYVETAMQSAQYTIENASSASEKSKATKAVTKYTKQLAEMKIYDEAIAHIANKRIEIDLDDGVKVNYAKFQGVEVAQEGKKTLKVDLLAKLK